MYGTIKAKQRRIEKMSDIFNMYVLTDVHYLSKELWTEGEPINRRERGDQIALKASPEITATFFDKIIADSEVPNVLITGDLVNCGELISHRDFKRELKRLTDAGKRVYVTTATHDYCGFGKDGDENIFSATGYGEKEGYPVEYADKSESRHLYDEYGPNSADRIHEESGSYSVSPEKGVRLIAINDNGNGRSYCGLSDDGFNWLTDEIGKAKKKGERIMLAVHHPVLPPWEIYRNAAEFEMFGGYERLKKIMCDEGVHVIFTGHTHVQNIQKYEDANGGYFYDVSTTALGAARGMMRRVSLRLDDGYCRITSVGIEKINGIDTSMTAYEYISRLNFIGLLERLIPRISADWDGFIKRAQGFLSVDSLQKHKAAVQTATKLATGLKMSTLAKFGRKYNGLSRDEIRALKNERAIKPLFAVLHCIFSGNAPFPPDTVEYKVFCGALRRVDDILNAVGKPPHTFIEGAGSLYEIAQPFLYNNRTGDDNEAEIYI